MDKMVAGVLTTTALAFAAPAHATLAAPPTMEAAMQAETYADLLRPIPNALALLMEEKPAPVNQVSYADDDQPYYPPPPPHHHHHHHHHHDHVRVLGIPVPLPPPPPPPHHHHHHHHHHQQI
jgi:hypothetical protein